MLRLRPTTPVVALLISLAVFGLALGAAHAQPPFTPPYYCVTDLGSLNNETTRAYDLNNQTQAVGDSDVGVANDHPFFWENGTMTDLGPIVAGTPTSANRINETGIVIATGRDVSGVDQAFYKYYGSSWWREIFHPGDWSEGWGVNNRIQLVGTYWVNSGAEAGPHPYVYHPRFGTIDLGDFDGTGRGEAYTINEKPQIGGVSRGATGECGTGFNTPVLWEGLDYGYTNFSLTVLPTNGPCHAKVMNINELNVAVGFTESPVGPTPVVWRKGHGWIVRKLEAGEFEIGAAMDVNESGLIVGVTNWATMWTITEERFNLNDYIFDESWNLVTASAINDQNEVVGTGFHNGGIRAFLLTPKPTPFTPCP